MLKLENYDERVAIEVMGAKSESSEVISPFFINEERAISPFEGGPYWLFPDGTHVLLVNWQPSERIEQAIMVVEKMRQDGFSFSACNDNFPEDKKEWYVEFSNDTIQRGVYAGTISLAICQAAVLTKGEQRGVYAGTISLAICQMAY